ncbi:MULTISPECIES: sucrose-specific PTS transporter subunit IIBC [Vibrio]|jgi:PTS system sucrose-specific IIC component|uniref:protein-N(pi)-phosphohistidine--sucrose phosphotransferase n=1 Tax=Vibrio natriegens NBRC 15636 = ATCC 14048 = DSM 759 TaxID=1219067 RepID=A0AAN1CXT3_VIBNA|nr:MULTISPECIES: sucrose-specific PTS transporter subunit IIBC [Vibrio]MEE3877509.1 sucrose-specific PTS transporter subunit IIBC [Vibrio sp. YYF0003]CAH0527796.1 PTS system trehalose-specific EIIBC component [Catenococcus thiocycli]AEX25168.1 PTS system, sucrose-specific IIBC component [Vibrio sp. EJY3]ALR17438.1 PTS system trehalose-specific transporter subunits IIBC [Vibrio natriegens NBRC 15636 = ATCC 14048 = DSM 759]ANQ14929.1 PTS maltose transporter subunit IIBC [Vibrio natriegens NBRC 1
MNYPVIAKQLLEHLGGKDNLQALAHCATRLRLALKDEEKVNEEAIGELDGVKGQFKVAGQYQIIFGSGIVNQVYAEMAKQTGLAEMSTNDVASAGAQKQNIVQRAVKGLSDIFVPIIPAIVAGGLLMGLFNLLTAQGLFIEGQSIIEAYPGLADLASMINTFANAPFVYLPVLLAFSASKKFGGNPFLGAALGMLMVHPDLLNGWGFGSASVSGTVPTWNILGLEIQKVGYQGSVLPVLVSAFILAKVELGLRKIIPSVLDNLLTPMLAIFITGFVTFTLVGPFTRDLGFMLGDGLNWLYDSAGFVGGALFGFIYAPFVITGMHHSFIAIETQLLADIATTGGTFIFPIAAMSNVAQGAAALAVGFTTRDTKMKGIAVPSGITGLLGITEPAMFGVNLKLRYPFLAAIVGSAVASAFITLFNVKAQALGAAGLPGIISISPDKISYYIIGMIISFITAFALTVVLGMREKAKQNKQATA